MNNIKQHLENVSSETMRIWEKIKKRPSTLVLGLMVLFSAGKTFNDVQTATNATKIMLELEHVVDESTTIEYLIRDGNYKPESLHLLIIQIEDNLKSLRDNPDFKLSQEDQDIINLIGRQIALAQVNLEHMMHGSKITDLPIEVANQIAGAGGSLSAFQYAIQNTAKAAEEGKDISMLLTSLLGSIYMILGMIVISNSTKVKRSQGKGRSIVTGISEEGELEIDEIKDLDQSLESIKRDQSHIK